MEVVSLTLFRIFFASNSPPSYLHEFLSQRDTEKWLFYVYSTLFCTSSCSSQSASQVLHRVSWIELTETNNNSTCWEEPKEEMRKGVAGERNKTGENESSRSRYKRILKTWSTATVTKEQLNILSPARDKFREFVVNCCLFFSLPSQEKNLHSTLSLPLWFVYLFFYLFYPLARHVPCIVHPPRLFFLPQWRLLRSLSCN